MELVKLPVKHMHGIKFGIEMYASEIMKLYCTVPK